MSDSGRLRFRRRKVRFHQENPVSKITNEVIETRLYRGVIRTRRNRLSGETTTDVSGDPSDQLLQFHLGMVQSKWGLRMTWPEFVASLVRR